MQLLYRASALALLAAMSGPAFCAHASDRRITAGNLVIANPWTRATPSGAKVAGGYLAITNKGQTPDELTGGSFSASGEVQIHQMSAAGGVMKMEKLNGLTIPAGGSITLAPGGKHMMFIGLKHGLKKGDHIDGTLTFAKAGTVEITFDVEDVGAKAPGGGDVVPGVKTN